MRKHMNKFRRALEWRGVTAKDIILGGSSLALMAGTLVFIIWALTCAPT